MSPVNSIANEHKDTLVPIIRAKRHVSVQQVINVRRTRLFIPNKGTVDEVGSADVGNVP